MINLKPQINQKLKEIPETTVSFFYPENWSKLPAISYYEISNIDLSRLTDKSEALTEVAFQVDMWGKESLSEISIQVDKKMREMGFKRDFSQDIAPANGVIHKTTRYRGVYSSIENKIFQ